MSVRTRRRVRRHNPWKGDARGHKRAALLGWAYRKSRRDPWAYLRARGVTPAGWRRYRSRHHVRKSGRAHRVKTIRGIGALNNPRRGGRGAYRSFVRSFAASHRRLRGPSLFRAAGRAWRGGTRRNPESGSIYFDNRRKAKRSRRVRKSSVRWFSSNKRRSRKGGRRRSARRNPVLPYLAYNRRSRRGSYRRNGILPYAAFNPSGGPIESVMEGFQAMVEPQFWTQTIFPLGAGFIAGQFVGGLVYGLAEKVVGADKISGTGFVPSLARVGSRAAGSALVSGLAYIVTKDRDIAGKVLAGGLVAVLASVIQEVFGLETYSKITGMSGIGDMAADLTSELKARIAESVRGEIARAEQGGPMSAFVSTQDLAPAPRLGQGPQMGAFVTAEELRTAPQPGSNAPAVADLKDFSDEFSDMMLI